MTDREKAFEQWWSLPVSRPHIRKSLAREAYYAAWGEAADEIERLRAGFGPGLIQEQRDEIVRLRAKNRELASTLATFLMKNF